MLDESMFEEIHEIAETSAYLKAVEEKDVSLEMLKQLPPYEELKELEEKLRVDNKINFKTIFQEPTGYYMIKCFLIADYAVDKAIFIKDVEAYRSMRFESARRRIAMLLYQRFVAPDCEQVEEFKKGSSVFQIIQQQKKAAEEKEDKALANNHPPTAASSASATATRQRDSLSHKKERDHHKKDRDRERDRDRDRTSHAERGERKEPRGGALSIGAGDVSSSRSKADEASHLHSKALSSHHQDARPEMKLQIGTANNAVGVYGKKVLALKKRVQSGDAAQGLFDEVAKDVLTDLTLDMFPRFLQSEFYRKYIRTKYIETIKVSVKDFTTFRMLGRGGFGAVHACRKKNSGTIYAMKCINKKLVRVKSALDNVMEERNVLTMMNSNFVTNLKYALQDEETLYLIMDLMLGGDLKFHLINVCRFSEKRARFYAAQVLLGLEHIHSQNIIYRDMKLENVLLDHQGHCRISDLGLAVVANGQIKGYAGTPGYTAPEMIKNKTYNFSVDIFSFGVMLYRMICGTKPFKGKVDRDLDKSVLERKPQFSREVFSKEAISLLNGLLQKKPEHRLGCGEKGISEIKEHPFFESIDWGLLEAGYIDPPFVPNKFDVNAASLKDIGDFDRAKYRHVKLDERFKARVKSFDYVSIRGLQDEMVAVLEKADENKNFEKFASNNDAALKAGSEMTTAQCCIIL